MVPLRGTTRLTRYLSTAESTHELPRMYAVCPSPFQPSSTPDLTSSASPEPGLENGVSPRSGSVTVAFLIGLPRSADAGPRARALAAVRGQLDYDLVPGDIVPGDHTRALRGVDLLAKFRGLRVKVLVERVFVLEAAHEPAARAGDPQRVHRQVLVLGHPDRNRLEILEERRAAQVAPARPDPALEPRLVPRADLPQLHPPGQPAGQVTDQRAEVDPVRGAEVDREYRRRADVVHSDDLHRQVVLADQPTGGHPGLGPLGPVLLVPGQLVLGGDASADRQAADLLVDPLRGPDAFGHLGARVGGHEHLGPHGRLIRPGVQVVQPPVPLKTDRHHHAHRFRLRRRGQFGPSGPLPGLFETVVIMALWPR